MGKKRSHKQRNARYFEKATVTHGNGGGTFGGNRNEKSNAVNPFELRPSGTAHFKALGRNTGHAGHDAGAARQKNGKSTQTWTGHRARGEQVRDATIGEELRQEGKANTFIDRRKAKFLGGKRRAARKERVPGGVRASVSKRERRFQLQDSDEEDNVTTLGGGALGSLLSNASNRSTATTDESLAGTSTFDVSEAIQADDGDDVQQPRKRAKKASAEKDSGAGAHLFDTSKSSGKNDAQQRRDELARQRHHREELRAQLDAQFDSVRDLLHIDDGRGAAKSDTQTTERNGMGGGAVVDDADYDMTVRELHNALRAQPAEAALSVAERKERVKLQKFAEKNARLTLAKKVAGARAVRANEDSSSGGVASNDDDDDDENDIDVDESNPFRVVYLEESDGDDDDEEVDENRARAREKREKKQKKALERAALLRAKRLASKGKVDLSVFANEDEEEHNIEEERAAAGDALRAMTSSTQLVQSDEEYASKVATLDMSGEADMLMHWATSHEAIGDSLPSTVAEQLDTLLLIVWKRVAALCARVPTPAAHLDALLPPVLILARVCSEQAVTLATLLLEQVRDELAEHATTGNRRGYDDDDEDDDAEATAATRVSSTPWPPLRMLVQLRFVSRLFASGETPHAVVTPLLVLLGRCLHEAPLTTVRHAACAVFTAQLMLDLLRDAKCFGTELLPILCDLLRSALPLETLEDDELGVSTRAGTTQCRLLYTTYNNDMEGANAEQDAYVLDFHRLMCGDEEQIGGADQYVLLRATVELLGDTVAAYSNLESFPELVVPLERALTRFVELSAADNAEWPGALIRRAVRALLKRVRTHSAKCSSSREPLQLHLRRAIPLPQSNPRIIKKFGSSGSRGADDTDADRLRRLKRKHRQMQHAAERELRKDGQYVERHRQAKRDAASARRDKSARRAMSFLHDTQAELKAEMRAAKKLGMAKAKNFGAS